MKKISTIIALSAILSSTIVYADSGFVSAGPKIGSQGIGADVRTPLSEKFFVRAGVNYFKYSQKFTSGQINSKGKLTLLSVPVMIDWHPVEKSGFKVSAGLAYNGSKLKTRSTPTKAVVIDGVTIQPNQIGSVTSKLTLGNSIAAIASVGYDSSFVERGGFSFNAEAGLMYSGDPKLSTSFNGLAKDDAKIKDLINKDAKKALDSVKKYLRFYPVFSVGVRYTF